LLFERFIRHRRCFKNLPHEQRRMNAPVITSSFAVLTQVWGKIEAVSKKKRTFRKKHLKSHHRLLTG
jgi:hypothetical protein